MFNRSLFVLGLTLFASAPIALAAVHPSVGSINQNSDQFIGKQVTLTGKIDRVLSPGSYIVSDAGSNTNDPNHKILVMSSADQSKMTKQQPGTVGQNLKEGDSVELQGKVERLSVSSETDQFSPKTDQETISEAGSVMPIVVSQRIQKVS